MRGPRRSKSPPGQTKGWEGWECEKLEQKQQATATRVPSCARAEAPWRTRVTGTRRGKFLKVSGPLARTGEAGSFACGLSLLSRRCLRRCDSSARSEERCTWSRNPFRLKAGEKMPYTPSIVSKSVLYTLYSAQKRLIHPI